MAVDKPIRKVVIGIDSTGNLDVTPSALRANKGDAVQFSSAIGTAFAVQFRGMSPLVRSYFQSDKPIDVDVHPGAAGGTYPYACAMLGSDGRIYLDSACPAIIIDW